MNSLIVFEIILIGAIVVIQCWLAYRTFVHIKHLHSIVPKQDFFFVQQYKIPLEDLRTFPPREILQNLSVYATQSESEINTHGDEVTEEPHNLFNQAEEIEVNSDANAVNLISPDKSANAVFDNILFFINVYLLRNTGAATDFNLIKDIVERNLDTEEDGITHSVAVPLYLGLMGTMVGIVFGLLNLFFISNTGDIDMTAFLGGVSVAMFASFWGLFCTVVNSSFNLKGARRSLERRKNDFYTFIQTELLPALNQSVSSSVYFLHQNLIKFNDNFSLNLNRLSGMLNKNHDALIAQERILQALEKIEITEFAKANVRVLKELKAGTEQLQQFNQYITNLSSLVAGTNRLSTSFEELLKKANNFHGLAERLDSRVEDSNKLVQFLNDHFGHLEERGVLIKDSIVKVEDVMVKQLKQLEEHTQTKIEAIKQITLKEEDLMTKTFAENRSHISKLALLEEVNKQMNEIMSRSASQIEGLKQELHELNGSFEKSIRILEKINNNNLIQKTQNITHSIRKLFGSNNTNT